MIRGHSMTPTPPAQLAGGRPGGGHHFRAGIQIDQQQLLILVALGLHGRHGLPLRQHHGGGPGIRIAPHPELKPGDLSLLHRETGRPAVLSQPDLDAVQTVSELDLPAALPRLPGRHQEQTLLAAHSVHGLLGQIPAALHRLHPVTGLAHHPISGEPLKKSAQGTANALIVISQENGGLAHPGHTHTPVLPFYKKEHLEAHKNASRCSPRI